MDAREAQTRNYEKKARGMRQKQSKSKPSKILFEIVTLVLPEILERRVQRISGSFLLGKAFSKNARALATASPRMDRPATSRGGRPAAALLDRANLTGLVLGCIEAKFCKKICV